MNRRNFFTMLAGAAAALPFVGRRAKVAERKRECHSIPPQSHVAPVGIIAVAGEDLAAGDVVSLKWDGRGKLFAYKCDATPVEYTKVEASWD